MKFISFEPLIKYPSQVFNPLGDWEWKEIDWIIIGADSRRGAKKPPVRWASDLIQMARDHDVSVWVKDNYPCTGFPGWFRPKIFPGGGRGE